jgi:hypothetical protein
MFCHLSGTRSGIFPLFFFLDTVRANLVASTSAKRNPKAMHHCDVSPSDFFSGFESHLQMPTSKQLFPEFG